MFSKTISDVEDMFNAVDSDNSDGVDIDELRDGLERLGVWLGQVSAIKSGNSFYHQSALMQWPAALAFCADVCSANDGITLKGLTR